VLNPFKRKEEVSQPIPRKAQTISVWSPAGRNTARFSLEIGEWLATITTAAIAELPCLGIPRLGFVCDILERERCTEAALQELERKGQLELSQLHLKSENLGLLPASVFATPDCPLINRLTVETLIDFPVKFINSARQQGYSTIIFECQGQVTSPMTFFALKNSDLVLLVIVDPDDLAFTLINVKRLVQVFKFPVNKFCLVGDLDPLELAELATVKDDEGIALGHLAVIAPKPEQVVEKICPGTREARPRSKNTKGWSIFT